MEQLFCSPQFEAFSPTLQPERIKFTLRKIQTISLYINPTVQHFKFKREIKISMLNRYLNSIILECGLKTSVRLCHPTSIFTHTNHHHKHLKRRSEGRGGVLIKRIQFFQTLIYYFSIVWHPAQEYFAHKETSFCIEPLSREGSLSYLEALIRFNLLMRPLWFYPWWVPV